VRRDGAIRVLVIDDSPLLARALAAELDRCADLHAVGGSGEIGQVRQQLLQYHPDVIILDLELRSSDPLGLLRKLRAHYPVPVLAHRAHAPDGALREKRALELGVLEIVPRPASLRPAALHAHARELAHKVRLAAALVRPVPPPVAAAATPGFRAAGLDPARFLVAIGASTGGTEAVRALLARAPGDFPPAVIVQHMPAGFTRAFGQRLSGLCALSVAEALEGEVLHAGHAVIARGDTHLVVRRAGPAWCVRYTDQRPANRHCPSVDVLFDSVAAAAGRQAVGVLLTGMGADGARGLLKLRRAGALTIGQSASTCVVYGMPKVAADLGAVMYTAAPEDIPQLIVRALRERAGARAAALAAAHDPTARRGS
jgi:two-component system chemotaxis response regulator CheB